MKALKTLGIIGLLAILAAIFCSVFFFGGYFNIAANFPDPDPVNWALIKVRTASIERHAIDKPPAGLDDPAMVKAGAQEFDKLGCDHCHGAPGVKWSKFSEGLNPSPPDLAEVSKFLTPAQTFWIVKNGIKMTGMPSFAAAGASDDDIWKIAAFVSKIASVSDADYKSWTAGSSGDSHSGGGDHPAAIAPAPAAPPAAAPAAAVTPAAPPPAATPAPPAESSPAAPAPAESSPAAK